VERGKETILPNVPIHFVADATRLPAGATSGEILREKLNSMAARMGINRNV